MIYIQRVPATSEFLAYSNKMIEEANAFYTIPLKKRNQQYFAFPSLDKLDRLAFNLLRKQFSDKCAYCESQYAEHIDRFRPRAGVAESSGEYLGDHYWRQAFSWENLYLVCPSCNRHKANRFPVLGKRAPPDADRLALSSELSVLLDPCFDNPDQHLLFASDGQVSGITDRGLATIEILGLNRKELVRERQREAKIFLKLLTGLDGYGSPEDYLKINGPYQGLLRAILKQHHGDYSAKTSMLAKQAQEHYDLSKENATTATVTGRKVLRDRARFIEHIEIRNIASIQRLDINLTASTSDEAPCLAILGTNGVGKTTILKCIALALAGPKHRLQSGVKARDLVRFGCESGSVKIFLSGFSKPIEMVVSKKTGTFKFQQAESRSAILAYGSSRLLPTNKHRPSRRNGLTSENSAAYIQSLFDPFQPMSDASKWLASIPSPLFDDAATVLKAILSLDSKLTFFRPISKGKPVTVLAGNGHHQTFSTLSDGYQSMLGLISDLIQSMYRLGFKSMRSAQGVVLIDELGNHLHPAWRMRVLKSLRQAFPQVQFIYSTHDPLCLKGLLDGEVVSLRKDNKGKVFALSNLPPVQGLRADQLLTSEYFGLESAIDPETDDAVRRYLELSRQGIRGPKDQDEFVELKRQLTEIRLLGQTWRERRLLEALDAEKGVNQPTRKSSIDVRSFTTTTTKMLLDIALTAELGKFAKTTPDDTR